MKKLLYLACICGPMMFWGCNNSEPDNAGLEPTAPPANQPAFQDTDNLPALRETSAVTAAPVQSPHEKITSNPAGSNGAIAPKGDLSLYMDATGKIFYFTNSDPDKKPTEMGALPALLQQYKNSGYKIMIKASPRAPKANVQALSKLVSQELQGK